jgi:ABC-type polysaccharide/polyol phosphate export permease
MLLLARTSYFSEVRETFGDFASALKNISLAWSLATHDIRSRYRGSVLGPWWITIAVGALVLGIGLNYASLLNQNLRDFLPYVAVGLVVWNFLSATISDGGESLVNASPMIRQSSIPLPVFVLRSLLRNLINLAHQLVILVGVFSWFRVFPGLGMFWALLGIFVLILNLGWISLILALVSARFRDVPQIVTSVLQFLFFVSPIFWVATAEISSRVYVKYNPLYMSVQAIREPLITGHLDISLFVCIISGALIGWAIALAFYAQVRRSVVHYL